MENPTLTIRIPGDLKAAVAEAAAADNRSVTSYVVTALYAALGTSSLAISTTAWRGKLAVTRGRKPRRA